MTRVSDLHRTAFVTGASTGLGRAFTEMLLADGVRVWGTSRDPARLASFAVRHPSLFTAVALELRDGARAEAVFGEADRAAEGFDLVINNAGYGVFGEFAATEFATWQEQLEVMLVSPARLSHAALRSLRARPAGRPAGALVNISSLAAEFPLPFQAAYNIAKSGLSALNESLMLETTGTGVVVIDFRPGDYRTDFDGSVRRPQTDPTPRMARAWSAFEAMMRSGPAPAHAAAALRRALLRHRSGTVRTGRFFQAVVAPFLARFGSLALKRRVQARYFDV
ncbi:MAG: SDR family NAD(P)-dependent oxidoreductase [Verrucomicrobia bacterium]|nr:SDR family NAD(P)-dependent oxidoreductase [Verrucomicrobiota bacterium]